VSDAAASSARPRIAAIVLAAGLSTRFGSFKPLAELLGKTLLARVLDTMAATAFVDPIVVVTGHRAADLEPILAGRNVTAAHNVNYAAGEMLSSVKAGLKALPNDVEAVVLALCDQPMVRAETVAALVNEWRMRRPRILLPCFQGKRGHPIVLSAAGFREIMALPVDATLKVYTSGHAAEIAEVEMDDGAVVRDIDTPDDLTEERNIQL
jgi:CTP:molybdopterin cytidylyltransferase MocA